MQADGLTQVVFPALETFFRQALHQVDADVFESCVLTAAHGVDSLGSSVPSVEQAQCLVVECLYADADAVER